MFDTIHRARLQGGAVTARDSLALPGGAYSRWTQGAPPPVRPAPAREKVHKALVALLANPATDSVTVLVSFRDTGEVPRIPVAIPSAPKIVDSLRVENARLTADSLLRVRALDYRADSAMVAAAGGRILRRYWLTHSLLVRLPRQGVATLAARSEVTYVRGARAGEPPPQGPCTDPLTPCAARSQIRSDVYFDAGFGVGRIALLDTGVRTDHSLLQVWPPRMTLYDCVGGDAAGLGGDPGDACTDGHGTSSAAILTGGPGSPPGQQQAANAPPPAEEYRGVTQADVESYKVYASCTTCEGCAELDAAAAKDAFQLAVIRGAPVIAAEIAGSDPEDLILIGEAEKAYQAGRIVLAANGNDAGVAARSPATSPSVLGVGAYDVRVPAVIPMNGLSGGITGDGILKPDLVAPSGTETAGARGQADFTSFSGTSGATPYATGAALMLWNLMRGDADTLDPGQVMAALVLATRGARPFTSGAGAGAVQLPVDCWLLWGKVGLAHGEQTTVPLDVPAAYRFDPTWVNAAIWWPRGSGGPARDVDLFLLDRSGQPAPAPSASSTSLETVFEWVGSQGRMAAGEAKLRIKATQVAGGGAQTVYWVAALGMR